MSPDRQMERRTLTQAQLDAMEGRLLSSFTSGIGGINERLDTLNGRTRKMEDFASAAQERFKRLEEAEKGSHRITVWDFTVGAGSLAAVGAFIYFLKAIL